MSWRRPAPADVWKAIAIYMRLAYPDEPPSAVRQRLDTLRSVREEEFYDCAALERPPGPETAQYGLRLGNQLYPHMKLVIGRCPDGKGCLFRADTHDRHICPDPKSRDYRAFMELMERNQQIAQRIESAWEAHGLPTFKTFLKQDLARRQGS